MLLANPYLWDSSLFYLDSTDIEELQKGVQSGEPLAYYALARYHSAVRPASDSVEFAIELLYRAADAGVADATAALALLWRSGDMGIVNREKSLQMLDEAFEQGSLLAAKVVLTDMICGIYREQDIKGAMAIIDERMSSREDSLWCYLKGLAIHKSATASNWQQLYPQAAEWYRKAADYCVYAALDGLEEVCTQDYYGEVVDEQLRLDIICEGCAMNYGRSICSFANECYQLYKYNPEQSPEGWQAQNREELNTALSLGYANAACCLGKSYLDDGDIESAWACFTRGAILGSPYCYEEMHLLMQFGHVSQPEEFMELTALGGARCGSIFLMDVVVTLYRQGKLQPYAQEIEKYYLPESLDVIELTI